MLVSHRSNAGQNHKIKVANRSIETDKKKIQIFGSYSKKSKFDHHFHGLGHA
jgi:hypothetical protein